MLLSPIRFIHLWPNFKGFKNQKDQWYSYFFGFVGEEIVAVQENWIQQDPLFDSLPSTTTLYALPSTLVELIDF